MYEPKCDVNKLKANSSQWEIYDLPIGYCLARKAKSRCKLQFSRDILIAVIICNLCKAAAMMATLLLQQEPTLVTTGDALSSWLQHPDEVTANQCLRSARTDIHSVSSGSLPAQDAVSVNGWSPVACHSSRVLRWHQAINRRRWATVLTLCTVTLAVAAVLLTVAYHNLRRNGNDFLKAAGFGAITSSTMIQTKLPTTSTSGLLANVLIANLPQLIFSCLYLLYNGLFTSMCLAHEYSNYSTHRKVLRVTSPRGNQRSTHWLHLPYVYGIPLLAASALLHWSISQSIFFVGIDIYDDEKLTESKFDLGFSVQPIILDMVLGSCMLFALVGVGFRKLHGKIPLASSNSFAISAACHRPEEDTDAAFKQVMWGEVQTGSDSGIGHCSFTSMEVTAPAEGRNYAGFRKREGVTR
jgi:hypothetical protein